MPPPDTEAWRRARVVVVVAHPDDEVLGCGALLAGLQDVHVVHVTDGAPRSGLDAERQGFATPAAYAAARRSEALAALALAGVPADRLTGLGLADQTVPDHLVALCDTLGPLLAPAAVVLTHAYEGGHGDHDAVAFAVHAACRRAAAPPALIEMPFYHAGPDGWVRQRFLPGGSPAEDVVLHLAPAERTLKAAMMAAHVTQAQTLAAFEDATERFRQAPRYDFRIRPHGGPLLYEQYGWSLTWPAWQARVADALVALGGSS